VASFAVDEELSDFVVNDDEATFVKSLGFFVFALYLSRFPRLSLMTWRGVFKTGWGA
jgi:hypothetical protein